MKGAAQAGRTVDFQSPTATCVVRFQKRRQDRCGRALSSGVGRIPRVTRLLALAQRIDGMIHSGEVRDLAEAARLAGVTRARMTQISNLLLMAPTIQEAILSLPFDKRGGATIIERELRAVVTDVEWQEQHARWGALVSVAGPDPTSCA